MDRPAPIDAARRIINDRYPNATVAILAGSVTTGRATSTSDLDLVVIAPEDEDVPYRQSFVTLGWPVEAFLHDVTTVDAFFELDARSGDCALATMVGTGSVVLDTDGSASGLHRHAQAFIDRGPPAMGEDELRLLRYEVTDLLDDLRGDPVGDETLFVAPLLAARAGTLFLAYRRAWRANGKWLLRRLQLEDADTADALVAAIRSHQQGDATPLMGFAEKILEMSGGALFDGFEASGKPLLAKLNEQGPREP